MIKIVAIPRAMFYRTVWQQILCKGRKDLDRIGEFQIPDSRFRISGFRKDAIGSLLRRDDEYVIIRAVRSFASLRMTAIGFFYEEGMLPCRSAGQHPFLLYFKSGRVIPTKEGSVGSLRPLFLSSHIVEFAKVL
jgi:hypothetical protein